MGEKTTRASGHAVRDLPVAARVFVAAVVAAGGAVMGAALWRGAYDRPALLSLLVLLSVAVHTMKVELPLGRSSSTLSLGYAVNFVSLLLLGSGAAVVVTVLGGWAQCSFNVKTRNPWYRTLFSVSCLVLSMTAGAFVLTGTLAFSSAAPAASGIKAVVISALAYFLCNSVLVATAVSLATRQSILRVWDQEYLWAAPNYFVGALLALLAVRAVHLWGYGSAALFIIPLFLCYRLYRVYLGRMDDERRHVREISQMHLATVEALALAIEAKDVTSRQHVRRVQRYATAIGRAIDLPDEVVEGIGTAALLHDIGKLGVPDHILAKSGPLTPEEFARVRRYPELGAEIVAAVPFRYPVAPFIRHHHERWDGTGYPDGLAGDSIPIGARIIAIAERYDALRTRRPYRPALSREEALAHLNHEAGKSLDPRLVARFIGLVASVEDTIEAAAQGVFDDISQAHGELFGLLEQAQADSLTDQLTELPNRRFIEAHISRELARAQRAGVSLVVLLVDVNDFKQINDRFGHSAGDEALKAVAQCLRRSLRPYDVCGRYGGDEFVLVLGGGADLAAKKTSELVRAAETIALDVGAREPIGIRISVGAAVAPQDGATPDEVLRAADRRMYAHKIDTRGKVGTAAFEI